MGNQQVNPTQQVNPPLSRQVNYSNINIECKADDGTVINTQKSATCREKLKALSKSGYFIDKSELRYTDGSTERNSTHNTFGIEYTCKSPDGKLIAKINSKGECEKITADTGGVWTTIFDKEEIHNEKWSAPAKALSTETVSSVDPQKAITTQIDFNNKLLDLLAAYGRTFMDLRYKFDTNSDKSTETIISIRSQAMKHTIDMHRKVQELVAEFEGHKKEGFIGGSIENMSIWLIIFIVLVFAAILVAGYNIAMGKPLLKSLI